MTTEIKNNTSDKRGPRLWIIYLLLAIIFVPIIGIRIFLYDFYSVPSGNMMPSINVGDMVVVDKQIYKNAARGKSNSTKPKLGEIIAFHPPHSPNDTFLGRVIATPGDTVQFTNKQLIINGKSIETRKVDEMIFSEKLESGIHNVRYQNEQNPYRDFSGTVPTNHYFIMGDNRDNSFDSREWGYLPVESLVGKVVIVL